MSGQIYPDLFSTLLVPKARSSSLTHTTAAARRTLPSSSRRARHSFREHAGRSGRAFPDDGLLRLQARGGGRRGRWRAARPAGRRCCRACSTPAPITGTWPVRTEQPGGFERSAEPPRVVDRPGVPTPPSRAPLATRKEFLSALKAELAGRTAATPARQHRPGRPRPGVDRSGHGGLLSLRQGGRGGRASHAVRSALTLINQVLDEILTDQEGDFDADTRWALAWFEQHGIEAGPSARPRRCRRPRTRRSTGWSQQGSSKPQATRCDCSTETSYRRPGTRPPTPADRVGGHPAPIQALADRWRGAAAALLRRVGGLGETARELAYRLYVLCDRKKWASEALAYNALVVAWPEIARLAGAAIRPVLQAADCSSPMVGRT